MSEMHLNDPIVLYDIDVETPVSIRGKVVRVDWYNAGEGICGDYNPSDPNDINLLRFDVYVYRYDEEADEWYWEPVDDASYCTRVPADTNIDTLVNKLMVIYKEYDDVLSSDTYASVKKLGEYLSWI